MHDSSLSTTLHEGAFNFVQNLLKSLGTPNFPASQGVQTRHLFLVFDEPLLTFFQSHAFLTVRQLREGQIVGVSTLGETQPSTFPLLTAPLACVLFISSTPCCHQRFRKALFHLLQLESISKPIFVVGVPHTPSAHLHLLISSGEWKDAHADRVQWSAWDPGFLPFEDRVFTLGRNHFSPDFAQQGDLGVLRDVALSLVNLEQFHVGFYRTLCAKGSQAVHTARLIERLERERLKTIRPRPLTPNPTTSIRDRESGMEFHPRVPEKCNEEMLLIVERSMDLSSPLRLPQTYEASWREFFPLDASTSESMRAKIHQGIGLSSEQNQPQRNPASLYPQIRDLRLEELSALLNKQATEVKRLYDRRHEATELPSLRKFVQTLPRLAQFHQEIKQHTERLDLILQHPIPPESQIKGKQNISIYRKAESHILEFPESEKGLEYIKDCILHNFPLPWVLRLLSLSSHSPTWSATREKKLCTLLKKNYPPDLVSHDLRQLTRAGVFRMKKFILPDEMQTNASKDSMKMALTRLNLQRSWFRSICRLPRAVATHVSGTLKKVWSPGKHTPSDCTLQSERTRTQAEKISGIVSLLLHLTDKLFTQTRQTLLTLPGETFYSSQSPRDSNLPGYKVQAFTLLVLGGLTYDEVSFIRSLCFQNAVPLKILTTHLMTGETFMRSMLY